MDRRQFMAALVTTVAVGTTRARVSFAGESEKQEEPGGRAIPKRILGKTGVEVSVLILGGVAVLVLVPLTTDVGQKLHNPNTTIAGEFALVILGIQRQRKADLLEIIATRDALGLVAGFTQTRQQDGQQQGNDGDYHQQFNQRKSRPIRELSLFNWFGIAKNIGVRGNPKAGAGGHIYSTVFQPQRRIVPGARLS